MAMRPKYTTSNANVKITVPPGWSATVIVISRKASRRLVAITNSMFPLAKNLLRSKSGKPDEKLVDIRTGTTSVPIRAQKQPATLDLNFYYSTDTLSTDVLHTLENDKFRSSKLQIYAPSKPMQAPRHIPDYMTIFVCIKDTFENAQDDTTSDDAIVTVQLNYAPETQDESNPNPSPPPPPSATKKGYPNFLDKPRPSTLENYLRDYHIVFLIDDSGSMNKENRWDECCNALIGISEKAFDLDENGIDIYFLNSDDVIKLRDKVRNVTERQRIPDLISDIRPSGGTPTGRRVRERLSEHLDLLDSNVGKPSYGDIKPLDLIVITDGAASDDPKTELTNAAARLKSGRHHPNWMGVQFVQIGNDPKAKTALAELALSDVGGMVDTVPYTMTITPEVLQRILLGGLHPNVRTLQKQKP